MEDRTEYPRMKYVHDQREWVRSADEKLPDLREVAISKQRYAALTFRDLNEMSLDQKQKYPFLFGLLREANMEAQRALFRVLYYEGMRRANLPEGE